MDDREFSEKFRTIFADVFGSSRGMTMLYWIADQCGYFATDPSRIDPALLAFFHRLLYTGGITPQKAGQFMKALVDTASSPVQNRNSREE